VYITSLRFGSNELAEAGPTDAAPIRRESAEVKITAAPKRLLGAELGRPVKLTKEFVVRALDLHRETTGFGTDTRPENGRAGQSQAC
jgi:hypothetical protein